MNLQQAAQQLRNSYSPIAADRKASLEYLTQLRNAQGGTALLMQVVVDRGLELHVRQAAVIRLKNIISNDWTVEVGEKALSREDRVFVRSKLVDVLVEEPASVIREQLLHILFVVAKHDFPDNWPELMPKLSQNINSGVPSRIYAAVSGLRRVFQGVRYREAKNHVRYTLAERTFPTLMKMCEALLGQSSMEAYALLYEVSKIFNISTGLSLPPFLKNEAVLDNFYKLNGMIVTKDYPPNMPEREADFTRHFLVKARKWATKTIFRHFSRFGQPPSADKKEKKFAKFWFERYSSRLLSMMLTLLQLHTERKLRMHQVMLKCVFLYIGEASKFAALWNIIRKNLRLVTVDSIVTTLTFTQEDLELWNDNPQQYLRDQEDFGAQFKDARLSALNFLNLLIKVRTQQCLPLVLQAISEMINAFYDLPQEQKAQLGPALKQDVALHIFAALRSKLLAREDLASSSVQIIGKHVIPLFNSPQGILRYRACLTVMSYCSGEFTTEQKDVIMQGLIKSLHDKELPVQLAAAYALQEWLERQEDVEHHVFPHVQSILTRFFKLFDEIGGEEVVSTLSRLSSILGPRIAPYAVKMIQTLTSDGLRLIEDDNEDDLEVLQMIMRCLVSIFMSMSPLPQSYHTLEQLAYPFVEKVVTVIPELIPEAFELIGAAALYSKPISERTWNFYPQILGVLESGDGVEYIDVILMTLDSYIANGTEVFLNSPRNYCKSLVQYCFKLLRDRQADRIGTYAAILLGTIMAHARGQVDWLIPDLIQVCFEALCKSELKALRLFCCDTLGIAAHYNPGLFLQVLSKAGPQTTQDLFNRWLSHLPHTKRLLRHQRMSLLGLLSLCSLPPNQLFMPDAVPAIIQQCTRVALQVILDEQSESDEEAEDDETFRYVGDDADDFGSEDEESVEEFLRKQLASGAFAGLGLDDPADPDEHNYKSPLDEVDELVLYCDTLAILKNQAPQIFEKAIAGLPDDMKNAPQVIMKGAQEHQKRMREEKEEQRKLQAEQLRLTQQLQQTPHGSPRSHPPSPFGSPHQ